MSSWAFTRAMRVAGIPLMGLGIGLALAACASEAGTPASGTGGAASPGPSVSATSASGKPGASPSDGTGASRVLLDCQNKAQTKPAKYELGCDDAINTLENLHWTRWGTTAAATGTEELNSCYPDCTGPSTRYPVTIEVDGDQEDVLGNPHVYAEMTIIYKGVAPVIDNGQKGGTITGKTAHSWTVKLGYPRG